MSKNDMDIWFKGMKRKNILVLLLAMLSLLSGCGTNVQQVVTITKEPYEKFDYQTVEVQRGDLSASVTLSLEPEGYEEIPYYASKEELELEKVHVAVGDMVKKGDILVSFESEKIKQVIADYEDAKKQNELLVEHYENLMRIDTEADYQADVKMLKEDIHVAQLYIEEAKNMLAKYQVVAEGAGVITDISEYLQNGVIKPGVELLTQVCGTGKYQAVTTQTDVFTVGEVYTATAGNDDYEMRLLSMEDNTLTFEPVSGMTVLAGGDSLTLTVEKPEQKDVVYVNRYAVYTIEGKDGAEDTYCVYVMQENGYQRAVMVTVGEQIEDNMIITTGLNGGEKVVIR